MNQKELIGKIIKMASDPSIKDIVFDCFCGLGGVTAGFSLVPGFMVVCCINHWDVAIGTHKKNFPNVLHLQEDFKTADLSTIVYIINQIRKNNPGVRVHLWLSLECTNFSNAKGGMSRDADSRTLADHVHRYVTDIDPDVIWIENVKEFLLWGPMLPKVVVEHKSRKKQIRFDPKIDSVYTFDKYIENGLYPFCPLTNGGPWMVPDSLRKGEDFKRWKNEICDFGYQVEQKLMNCADYGVPQHRVRLIMQFTRKGIPAAWPEKTHSKHGVGLPKWLPVKDCLDLEDEGDGVLTFKTEKGKKVPRIRSEATINRLIAGCLKHVIGKQDPNWIVKYNSACNNTDVNKGSSIDNPAPTITCFNGGYVAKAHLIDHYYGNGYVKSVNQPAGVTGTKDGAAMHTVQYLGTYHSNGDGSKVDQPAHCIMSKDKYPLVSAHFMDAQYSSGQQNTAIDDPSGAVLGVPKQKLVQVDRFVMDTQYNNVGHSIEEPAGTQTANRKHFYLVNFQWFNEGFRSLDNPANTIISRMDKTPNYLITLETGELAIEVFDYDPPHYVKMKKFMAEHGIISINMRMLNEHELLRIMTIPEKTKLSPSSTANKKMIGNAVPSELVRKLGAAYRKANTYTKIGVA